MAVKEMPVFHGLKMGIKSTMMAVKEPLEAASPALVETQDERGGATEEELPPILDTNHGLTNDDAIRFSETDKGLLKGL